MPFRLADGVQVRRESWGLLFYRPVPHKLLFVRSGDWLYTTHFDGSWTFAGIVGDIARRTGAPEQNIKRSLPRLADRLVKNGVISDEIR
jgi:putative mycofactocin binding protein MftB